MHPWLLAIFSLHAGGKFITFTWRAHVINFQPGLRTKITGITHISIFGMVCAVPEHIVTSMVILLSLGAHNCDHEFNLVNPHYNEITCGSRHFISPDTHQFIQYLLQNIKEIIKALPFTWGTQLWLVDSQHKGQWSGTYSAITTQSKRYYMNNYRNWGWKSIRR